MRNFCFLAIISLLLVLLVVSIFRRRVKRIPRALRVAGLALLTGVMLFWWFNPGWAFPETTGQYQVAKLGCTYIDENRMETYRNDGTYRWLNVGFWYPSNYPGGNQTCPLIVFSHGSFGIKESNETLYRELANRGYVVCAVDHTYQCLSTPSPEGGKVGMDRAYMKQVLSADDSSPAGREELSRLFSEWMDIRMGDLSFVLDTVIARSKVGDSGENGVYLMIDPLNIGVIGHSLGGSAALGIGRVRDDVKAVVALEAPFMYDVKACEDGALVWEDAAYPVPLLSVYSDASWDMLATSPQYRQNQAILNDSSGLTHDIYVRGAGHMTLTDLAYSMPPLCLMFGQDLFLDADATVRRLNQTILAFFDCYLKDGGPYTPAAFG